MSHLYPWSRLVVLPLLCSVLLWASGAGAADRTFGEDVVFLNEHVSVVELTGADGQARVAVVPEYQGRVMTSTAGGVGGDSFGWINYALIESGKVLPHMTPFGGEDRFWIGPEGGQFSIFFKKGETFTLKDWQTPAVIDSEPFTLVLKKQDAAHFRKQTRLVNYSGTVFDFVIDRTVRLLSAADVTKQFGVPLPDSIRMVAYESNNRITNRGTEAWTKETGLLSIWILGMYKPAPSMTIVIPFKPGPESELGPRVNDTYFGKVPAERLVVKDDILYFSGDGQHRSKIGINPARARPVSGSYNADSQVLTLVQFNLPEGAVDYVNSMWELQDEPFAGDAVNSYNDGPPEPGKKPLGPFFELETSSPALALKPGATGRHIHRTVHLRDREEVLDRIARQVFGVGLEEIKQAL